MTACISKPRLLLAIGTALVALFGILDIADAAPERVTEDRVIVVRNGNLEWLPAAGGEPTLLLGIDFDGARIRRMEMASDGSAMLLDVDGRHAWVSLTGMPEAQFVPCSGPAHLSTDGQRVVCPTKKTRQTAIYTMKPTLAVAIVAGVSDPHFLGTSTMLLHREDPGLATLGASGQPGRQVSDHAPTGQMLVAPNGKRGVGIYSEATIDVVYTFGLEKQSARRTLMQAARPVGFSADSEWVAIQQERDACAVRAVGGHYKCWRHYEALAVSSHGRSVLLAKENDSGVTEVYLGEVAGPDARRPRLLVSDVEDVAIFWPTGDQSQPVPDGAPEETESGESLSEAGEE